MHTTFQITLFILITKHFFLSYGQQFNTSSIIRYPKPRELKYAVHLKAGNSVCTGSIVHEEWVLTAAHCLYRGESNGSTSSEVEITAGMVDGRVLDRNIQKRRSSDVIIHPDFTPEKMSKYDIALVKVNPPFYFTNAVRKITLSANPLPQDDKKICFAYGYGAPIHTLEESTGNDTNTTNGTSPRPVVTVFRLRMWTTKPQDGVDACPCCKRFQCKRMFCSGLSEDEVGLCQADSGGGLVCHQCNPSAAASNTTSYSQSCESSQRLYGVAHVAVNKMNWTRNSSCQMMTVSDTECSDRPAINVFMNICPLTLWLAKYVPVVPPECERGRGTSSGSGKPFMLCFICFAVVFRL